MARMSGEYPAEWLLGETLGRADVARLFNVSVTTVTKWSKAGRIGFFRSPSGIRIYPECEVMRIMRGEEPSDFVRENAQRDNEKYERMWREDGWRNATFDKQAAREARLAREAAEAEDSGDD